MKKTTWILAIVLLGSSLAANPQQETVSHFSLEYHGPVAYSDRATQTLFYAESDGHHLVAIQFGGKILWTRDLYADTAKVLSKPTLPDESDSLVGKLARTLDEKRRKRKIVSIASWSPPPRFDPKKTYLSIAFSSADFLIVDASSGGGLMVGRD